MQNYRIAGRMGEGTFSEVLKCQSMADGQLYACKKMKQKYDTIEQVNNLREIQALRRLNPHSNIIDLKEVIFDKRTGTLALICELMSMNMYELIRDRRSHLAESKVKLYMYQLCKAIYHMHRNGIFHRDVKPENILIKDSVLKLADFGSCKSVYSKLPYTEYISTRWYRPPECLLTDGHYDHRMDMWSVGCVVYEITSLRPLFPGTNEVDQVALIHQVCGTPSPTVLQKFRKHQSRHMEFNFPRQYGKGIAGPYMKHASKQCCDLVTQLCAYDPDERLTAKQALRHPYFKDLREAERRAKQMVTSPSLVSDVTSTKTLSSSINSRRSRGKAAPRHKSTHRAPHLPQVPEFFALNSSLGPKGKTDSFKLPQIDARTYRGLNPAPSNKSTAHGSFLPSLYNEKAKHALYPGMTGRHAHASHRHHPLPKSLQPPHLAQLQGRDPV
ncbi:MAPK/MAK/MRK overlapping kinase-like isoform X2 [Halichondria panicea]|uniref:MAPK/MAK/MRK overlapping kinase-like isoform X2 n=1 Tax=Halichondria panicea TaxID=6063 RepID=UPI00312B3DD2